MVGQVPITFDWLHIVLCLRPVICLWTSCFISCLPLKQRKVTGNSSYGLQSSLRWRFIIVLCSLPQRNITQMILSVMWHLLAHTTWDWSSHEAGVEYNKNMRWHVCLYFTLGVITHSTATEFVCINVQKVCTVIQKEISSIFGIH